jgi:heme-degrading monooxygenase HmoA
MLPLPPATGNPTESPEVAPLSVIPGCEREFEEAFTKAQNFLASSPGYLGHELAKCHERASEYILLVRWSSIEAHEINFSKSANYQEWKALLHHFYSPFPVVSHYTTVRSEV